MREETWKLSCQNGCDAGKIQSEREDTLFVQEVATGKVRAYCFACLCKAPLCNTFNEFSLELCNEFVFWPVIEDKEFE